MKIYIDLAKQAITNTTDEKVYEGDFYSNVFEVLFYNYEDENWFPTMSQLAPNGRKAGDFTADALGVGESHTYVEDGKTYLRFTFTMGATWVLMKGKSNFYIWMNRLNGTVLKKCVGMVNVMIDQSTDNYFIADVTFNPNVKAYIDSCIDEQNEAIAQLGNGEPKYFDTAANIALLEEDKGLAVATDTGHLYYWDVTEEDATKYTDSGLVYNDLSAYYTKTQADALLANKADKSTTYTKTESDNRYAQLGANNTFTGDNDFQGESLFSDDINQASGDFSSQGNVEAHSFTKQGTNLDDIYASKSDTYTKTETDNLLSAKADKTTVNGIDNRVGALENEITDLQSVQNVVDVVATKSALNSYDTSKLEENDKIQVITDETHSGASTIYNWNGSAWQYVGAFGGNSYTKAETYNKTQIDSALSDKADKTTAITHTGNQLQDYSGNNVYPTLEDGQVNYSTLDSELKQQDATKVSYLDKSSCEIITGWTNPSNKYLTTQNVTTIDINNPATSVSANDFQYAIVECTAGDKFIINGYDGSNMRCWCFTDASYNKISASMYNTGNQEHRYTVAPTNAKYLIVQRRLSLNNNPSYKFTDLPNNYFAKLFEYGGLNQYGVLTSAIDRMRTIDFVDENIEYIETASNNSSYSLWIRFYDANGDIVSSFGNTYNVNYVNFDELRALYPTYKFKVVLRLDQLGDTPFENIYIHYKNCFVGNKDEILFEVKRLYKTIMFYPYKFKMEAHRGLSNVYPQNTLKAFEGAGKQSFVYGIETDVQMTSDGVLVCFHDDTLDTLTTGTGAVSSYTWANLQNVVYDNTAGTTQYPNETIPKFEDYLKVCRKYGKVPYIEIKNLDSIGISKLVDLVRTMGFVNRCVFTSFNFTSIKYLSYSAKNDFFIEYMINSGVSITTAISQAKPYNIDAIRVNYNDVTEELVNTAHQNGYLIDCWGINYGNTDAYDNMINCGVEGCTCDNWSWATVY